MVTHFSTVTIESEFRSKRYKMIMRYTVPLPTVVLVTLMASKWATKKKYFVWSSLDCHMTLMMVIAGVITIMTDVNVVIIIR